MTLNSPELAGDSMNPDTLIRNRREFEEACQYRIERDWKYENRELNRINEILRML